MLFLVLELGQNRYVIETTRVVEVLPLVHVRQIPQAPPSVVGAFNYRGTPLPVVDLSELVLGRPSRPRLSTRMIVVGCTDDRSPERLVGLIAECVTDTVRRAPSDFIAPGVGSGPSACLGPIATDAGGLVQWIDINRLLPTDVRHALFCEPVVP